MYTVKLSDGEFIYLLECMFADRVNKPDEFNRDYQDKLYKRFNSYYKRNWGKEFTN